tara:strand:+ start:939 stop:1817 length:879 start_codon:yes stop_codon:yes gene_type:complete
MLEKLKYPLSTGSFKEKPFRTIYYIFIILIADFLKLKINYKASIEKSNFFYNYKPHTERGLGGRGQFILREYYDKFFFIGHNILPKKFNFIDVGCSRGFFSLYLLGLQNFNGKGLCIDPLIKALDDFKEILKLNKKNSVRLIHGVVSDKKKLKIPVFKVSKLGYYSINKSVPFADKLKKGSQPENFLIDSYRIDELVNTKNLVHNVKFIKIDAEGAEYEILLSAKQTIKKYKPIFYCEVTHKKKLIENFLKKNNYILFNFKERNLLRVKGSSFKGGELLAIHKNDNYFSKMQ